MPIANSPGTTTDEPTLGTLRCPSCSFLNPPTASFCRQCGGAVGESLGYRTKVRWIILGLVFLGTTINYVDRQVLSLIAKELHDNYHISNTQYGRITAAFSIFYAIGQMAAGGWLDRIGARLGYGIALVAWSISSMLHAVVRTAFGFGIARVLLGLSESPAYPGATKILAEWFPRKERALAMGWVNGGSNLGMLVAAACVPFLTAHYGVPVAFLFTGALGLVFVIFWFALYRRPEDHPGVSTAEFAYIRSDPPESVTKVPWLSLFKYSQTWAFVASKFITDSMWTFLIFFGAKFLGDTFDLKISKIGLPMIVVYLLADLGSIGGGWMSSRLIKNGVSVNVARKVTLLVSALAVVPVIAAPSIGSLWPAVCLVGLAMAAHQGFSSNQYTLVSDMFPRRAVGSVAGMGGSLGYIGGAIMQIYAGHRLDQTNNNYQVMFSIAGAAYLVALLVIQFFAPRLERVDLGDSQLTPGIAPPPTA